MNRSRSVSSSTEALDSDHARYITSRIVQHERSLATGTRSLPTDSPFLYYQQVPHERGQMSEGVPSDMDLLVNTPHIIQNVQIPNTNREFWRDGQVPLPQLILNQERVIYIYLLHQ